MNKIKIGGIILLFVGIIGLLAYEFYTIKTIEIRNLIRGCLLILTITVAFLRPQKVGYIRNKKEIYKDVYPDYIGEIFLNDEKKEKQFYNAVDKFTKDKADVALKSFLNLNSAETTQEEKFTLNVFSALCYDEMGLFKLAAEYYSAALEIKPDTTLASNLGLCYNRLGEKAKALMAYEAALKADETNEYALNNIGNYYFEEGEYAKAVPYLEKAVEKNNKLVPAFNAATVCYALLGDNEKYEKFYRKAVSLGSDGKFLKELIESLKNV